ncbi:MAG: COG2426 family protein [Candidatus Hadarchaeaceae archaeon]
MELLIVLLLTLVPTFEARYTIPAALALTDLNLALLYTACVALNLIVIPIVFVGLDWLAPPLRRRYRWIDSIFKWFWKRGHGRQWRFLALVAFVSAPLPGTGAYTGTLMAYLLDLDRKPAAVAIALGVILSATLMTLAALGIISLAKIF